MKIIKTNTTKKNVKAIAVVLILGYGCFQNMENNYHTLFKCDISKCKNTTSDSIKSDENKLYIYTKSLLKSGISHLILNL